MRDGRPSVTASRVAAYRLGFERLPHPGGDPLADERLASDVAAGIVVDPDGDMAAYLRARTAFFDRVVIRGLERRVPQLVTIGAGYDGRAWRYAQAGVRWFEVDHPATQEDKRARLARLGIEAGHVSFVGIDLSRPGLADALVDAGYRPDATGLVLVEGTLLYLERPAVAHLLDGLRAVATVGTRVALSVPRTRHDQDGRARRDRFAAAVEDLDEPVANALTSEDTPGLLGAHRWRPVELSERAHRVGFAMAAPDWVPGDPPTRSRIGPYLEEVFHRRGAPSLGEHLARRYGIEVRRVTPLDVGVWRVERTDGPAWVARMFPDRRPEAAAAGDAAILAGLRDAGYPAERPAHPEPVSVHDGQAVLVTEHLAGRAPGPTPDTFAALSDLLGRLHTLPAGWAAVGRERPDAPAAMGRPGGAWHHLADGGPAEEQTAALRLLDDAGLRIPPAGQPTLASLRADLAAAAVGAGLPEALAHPDPVQANAIAADTGIALVDWTGAGLAPRVWPLAFLLWAAGSRRMTAVDAAVASYRSHVQLEADEVDQLAAVMCTRPLVLTCWSFAVGGRSLAEAVETTVTDREKAAAIADRARRAFAGSF
jgi:methyltransferase (TIGR00027 family)